MHSSYSPLVPLDAQMMGKCLVYFWIYFHFSDNALPFFEGFQV